MEVKKSPKADLEGKKSTWLLVGYVLILAVMFVAFEWTNRDKDMDDLVELSATVFFEEEIIPITLQEKPVAPAPAESKPIAEMLEIVEDDAEIEETIIASTDDTGPVVEIKNIDNVVVAPIEREDEVFMVAEHMPEFPGGMGELIKYLQKTIKYPSISQDNGVQGRVVVQFIVNTDGSIVDPVVVKSVDPYLDKEAIRVVKAMPKWKPGQQRGKAVRVKFTLPVQFRLQ